MKSKIRIFISLFVYISLILPLSSCKKASYNGDLDGNWRIVSIENIENGTITKPVQQFIAFQLHLVQLSPVGIYGNLQYNSEDSILLLDFPYSENDSGEFLLSQYGIDSNPITFYIEELNSKHLRLRSKENLITCDRF